MSVADRAGRERFDSGCAKPSGCPRAGQTRRAGDRARASDFKKLAPIEVGRVAHHFFFAVPPIWKPELLKSSQAAWSAPFGVSVITIVTGPEYDVSAPE